MFTPDLLPPPPQTSWVREGLNLALGLITSCCSRQVRLHAVDEGPGALVTPVKTIRVGVGLKKLTIEMLRDCCSSDDIIVVLLVLRRFFDDGKVADANDGLEGNVGAAKSSSSVSQRSASISSI